MTGARWLPGVTTLASSHDGGSMTGLDAYFTWHTYEAPYTLSALEGARRLIAAGNEVHFCLNPVQGGLVQILPADRAARGLLNLDGGVQTNRQGRVHLQVEVIGYAAHPWIEDLTPAGRQDLARMVAYADSWGVPRTHPNGDQGPLSATRPKVRSVTAWNGPGGHFCHGDVPENDHWDHGPIRLSSLWAAADQTTTTEEAELMAITVRNPLTGVMWALPDALWSMWKYAIDAARDSGLALAKVKIVDEQVASLTGQTDSLHVKVDDVSAAVSALQSGQQAAVEAAVAAALANVTVGGTYTITPSGPPAPPVEGGLP